MTDKQIINQIESVRKINNVLWMNIVRLALELDNARTKKILKEIRLNDTKISSLFGELSK